jgi:hypothetical protein
LVVVVVELDATIIPAAQVVAVLGWRGSTICL